MLAGRVSNDTNRRSPTPILTSSNPGHPSEEPSQRKNGYAWNIYNIVTSGLTGTNPSSNANLEESTTLIKAD